MRLHITASLIAMACAMTAADGGSTDLRLRIGVVPGISEVQSDSGAGGRSTTEVDDQGGLGIAPTVVWTSMFGSQAGLVVGTGLFWREHEWEYESESGSYEAMGISLLVGPAFRPTPQLQLELTPFVEFGIGEESYETSSDGGMDNGLYFAYGVQAAVWYALSSGLLLGVEAGYMAGEGAASYTDSGGNDNDWTEEFSGLTVNLGLGYRF
jgi:hypothetical protein